VSPSPRRVLHRGRKPAILGWRGGAALLKVFDNAGVPVCWPRCHAPLVYFKGGKMRVLTASLLIACMAVFTTQGHAQWTDAKIPGEKDRTVQGCAGETRHSSDWACIFVRCDQRGSSPSLHFSTSGPDIQGTIKLVIDGATFTLTVPDSPRSPLLLSTRAEAFPADLLEAIKGGSMLSIEDTGLKPPNNHISLQNSRKAIEHIELTCGERSHSSAASIWRRIRRNIFF
jgi:hypothetical protein